MPLRTPDQFMQEGSRVFHRAAPNKDSAVGWLRISERFMKDAVNTVISPDLRLIAAYQAMLNFAFVVVSAQGYRVTAADGHHVQTLEAACALIGASTGLSDRIDAIRDVRNDNYAGIECTVSDVASALKALNEFTPLCAQWLATRHPTFLKT